MNFIYSALIGYIIGSFPTAYILLKKTRGIDITKSGSGNVGAMNSYEVSNSKRIGIYVLLIDASKGFLSSIVVYFLIEESFLVTILSLIFAVFAHCYSPWIKFKGGRGLATAAGGAFFISLPVLAIWLLNWAAVYLFSKSIHLGNFMATLFTAISSFTIAQMMIMYSFIKPNSLEHFSYLISILMLIILSKHIIPMRDYMLSFNNKKDQQK